MHKSTIQTTLRFVIPALGVVGLLGILAGVRAVAPITYLCTMILPGAVLGVALARRASARTAVLAGWVASPVLVVLAATVSRLAGGTTTGAAAAIVVATIAASLWLSRSGTTVALTLSPRQWAGLAALALAFAFLTGYFPLSDEWWRARSDAWYHYALVAQIDTYGLPPEDMYFVGFDCQYMWFYHVLLLTLSKALRIDAFLAMPIVNMHAMIGLVLAAFSFGYKLREKYEFGIWSALTVVLGFNALFWVFLPIKMARALTGDVTGTEELSRIFSLSPFDIRTVYAFLHVFYNHRFFLDKFIVSTALSLGLLYYTAFWFYSVAYIRDRGRAALFLCGVALVGMLGFHPMVGFAALVGVFGAVFFAFVLRKQFGEGLLAPTVHLALAGVVALALLSPYLYSLMSGKTDEQLLPIIFAPEKIAGMIITCALALALIVPQRRFVFGREPHMRYYMLATACVILFAVVLNLPGPNLYDKPPFFVWLPLALVAAWSLTEFSDRAPLGARRRRAIFTALVLFLPTNGLALFGYAFTEPEPLFTPDERTVAGWLGDNTDRDAVIIEGGDRVRFVVGAPRRYLYGRNGYAHQWGYERLEMARRHHAREQLFDGRPLDRTTLEVLGGVAAPLYVVVRENDPPNAGRARFDAHPELFEPVFTAGAITVFRVDRAACRAAAPGRPTVSDEALLAELPF